MDLKSSGIWFPSCTSDHSLFHSLNCLKDSLLGRSSPKYSSSRAPGLTSGLQGSVNVHRGALMLVLQWQCISSFVFFNFKCLVQLLQVKLNDTKISRYRLAYCCESRLHFWDKVIQVRDENSSLINPSSVSFSKWLQEVCRAQGLCRLSSEDVFRHFLCISTSRSMPLMRSNTFITIRYFWICSHYISGRPLQGLTEEF